MPHLTGAISYYHPKQGCKFTPAMLLRILAERMKSIGVLQQNFASNGHNCKAQRSDASSVSERFARNHLRRVDGSLRRV